MDKTALALPPGYRLLEVLSEGGGRAVVRALRVDGAREETVLLRLETGPDAAEARSELSVLAAVDHPGIASLVDHGPLPGGGRFLARPWIEGQDLRAWASGRTPEACGAVVARLTPALDHLHRQGFVHGDLKPENVVVGPDDEPVLCDFGLATRWERERPPPDEAPGPVSGTLFSLAPEVLLGLAPSPKSDLFALGVLLHRLLVEAHRSARDFYAAFPQASFLDAIGTDPEELPPWSRDLVVQLTARAPDRRPRSAAVVGRTLADRLGVELDGDAAGEAPDWPVGTGRDAWLAAWYRRLEAGLDRPVWVRTPAGEDPEPLFRHLRIYAALRTRRSRGFDLASELTRVANGVELDRWAGRVAREPEGDRFLLVRELDPWRERALESLVRAFEIVDARGGSAGLVCVSSSPPPDGWDALDVPPVDASTALRFTAQHFPREEPDRREALAERLAEAAGGSATTAGLVLARGAERGLLVADGDAFRLRPGELPDLAALLPRSTADETVEHLTEAERGLLEALDVCGEEATPDEMIALAERAGAGDADAFLGLRRAGQVRVDRTPAGPRARRVGARSPLSPDEARRGDAARRRALHAARAADLEARGEATAAALHGWLAEPGDDARARLVAGLATLRDTGRAEVALALTERIEALGAALGVELVDAAPEVLVERARAWTALGRTEPALAAVEPLEGTAQERIAAGVELVKAKVEALRHRTEPAFEAYARAASLHRSAELDATVGRIELLHSLGRDREVREAVAAFAPREREAAGELSTRWRVYLESLDTMSAHRLGEEAAAAMRALRDEAHAAEDVGLEAALRIDLALIERASGSLASAREELERAIELYDRAGLVAGVAHARGTLGGILRELGELVEAETSLVQAMEARHRLGDREGAATMRGMLGLLAFERGHARAAVETLEGTAQDMAGAQRRRFAPLLDTLAIETRARIGDLSRLSELPADDAGADPRILASKARVAWKRGAVDEAVALFERAASLAEALKLDRLGAEARAAGARARGDRRATADVDDEGLVALDARVLRILDPADFDAGNASSLAHELERRGRDDRAARLLFALASRTSDEELARDLLTHAESVFSRCASGLTTEEASHLRMHLLNEPDPWPGDLATRDRAREAAEPSDDFLLLLEVNRRLTQEDDLPGLLGAIVDHALHVTGAERGFLVLEEHGELRFDTALDSCKGDIEQPEFEVSASVIRSALDEMAPVRVSNAVDDPLMGHRTSVMSLELRSILCVPFEVSSRLRGAIYVDHRLRKGAFDERAERLCSLLADQAALAILQLRRLDEIRGLNRELERRVVEREADLSKARRALIEVGAAEPVTELVGDSEAMREVRALLARAGPADLPVLITGDSGTGKELAARALHQLSPRRDGRFVSESCAALPPTLIESELFGYRRGAFTGAERDHGGLIEQANDGTLFLDEIGELPLDLQAKLLRVLETGEVRRIGENEPRPVDFRLVSATNRDLEAEVREDRFRADLFYRLDGLRVVMPPLADRREDIAQLARHFLELESRDGHPGRRISRPVLTALARRAWPGNVRELRNEVARLCVLSDGDLDDPSLVSTPASTRTVETPDDLVPLAELERRAILRALEKTGGDKRRAAELLGISRAKIYQRLKEWREEDG